MRIKFIQTFATDRDCYAKGKSLDMTTADAKALVKSGIAVSDEPVPDQVSNDAPMNPIARRRKGAAK